ncbi:MAG: hypothetical protein AB7I33_07770 [Gemmatimonadales bacterium]
MHQFRPAVLIGLALPAFLACDGGTKPDTSQAGCTSSTPITLAAGGSVILDATVNGGCVQIPAAGPAGAQYLVAAVSAAPQVVQNGISGSYTLTSGSVTTPAPPGPGPSAGAAPKPDPATGFHFMLRARERALAADPARRIPARPQLVPPAPPQIGDVRTFKVCSSTTCNSFVNVTATAQYVGARGAIYQDNTLPTGAGYTQGEIDQIGALFDGASPNMYEIDTTAFGRESDLDANGVVIILLTPRVNLLSGSCNQTQTAILGYFFGLDLVNDPNSNQGEIFYGLVPDPNNTTCTISRNFALGFLPPTFIHEFQHMISFNQHVLIRNGATEQTWLNEGFSHFAEELGGRQLPDAECPLFSSCLAQFAGLGDLANAQDYLTNTEASFLVYPGSSLGTIAERGASWLFIRWLADHFATDSILGTGFTRAMLQTNRTGAANLEAVTGETFATLVGQWQMANYLEGVPGFPNTSGRLTYRSWNLAQVYSPTYPLTPDGIVNGTYSRTGVLRAGSGHHALVTQAANSDAVRLRLQGGSGFAGLVPRLAVARIR